jgi:putative pyrroloquinoline-quinone binding quinoprotein/reprolysin-like metallo-peptidase family M12B
MFSSVKFRCRNTVNSAFAMLCCVSIVTVTAGSQPINEDFFITARDERAIGFGEYFVMDDQFVLTPDGVPRPHDELQGVDVFNRDTGEFVTCIEEVETDGEYSPDWGSSMSISNGIVAIGSPFFNSIAYNAGSVYLFNATTGNFLGSITPGDAVENDWFGITVSIDNDILAVSGNHGDFSVGTVYVYDALSGTEITRIINQENQYRNFGFRLAVKDGIVAVSDIITSGETEQETVYLYDAITGTLLHQITQGVLPDRIGFGVAIDIDNGVVAISAPLENLNSGAVYLYNVTTGNLLQRLTPNGSRAGDRFGQTMQIDGGIVTASAVRSSGRVFQFDVASGNQIAELAPSHSPFNSTGSQLAAHQGVVAIGATAHNKILIYNGRGGDSDGDGLTDDWEENGIPYTDSTGATQRYMLPGADPLHKDLYVEVDMMSGHLLPLGSILYLEIAFDNAPLSNPDGIDGISLHVVLDNIGIPFVEYWPTNGCWPLNFDTYRTAWFGTDAERNDPDATQILAAKGKAYRYCITAANSDIPSNVSGCGVIHGDNFVIFLSGTNTLQKASVFMHELGHNLGLDHGGRDSVNGKPNYPSIMNYTFANQYNWNQSFWDLDYSREGVSSFGVLDESSLDEIIGIGVSSGYYSNWQAPFGINMDDGTGTIVRDVSFAYLNGTPTDFGDAAGTMIPDQVFTPSVAQDLNYALNPPFGLGGIPDVPSPGDVLEPCNDWAFVRLKLAAAIGENSGPDQYPTDELTKDAIVWLEENIPAPPGRCLADLNFDNTLDFFDVAEFLELFSSHGIRADFTRDGILDFFDVSAFLQAFADGCP